MMYFSILDLEVKGTLTNIYGPSTFTQKSSFLEFLRWVNGKVGYNPWIMARVFNMISSPREKKGSRRIMDKLQESFKNFIKESHLFDLEIGN